MIVKTKRRFLELQKKVESPFDENYKSIEGWTHLCITVKSGSLIKVGDSIFIRAEKKLGRGKGVKRLSFYCPKEIRIDRLEEGEEDSDD